MADVQKKGERLFDEAKRRMNADIDEEFDEEFDEDFGEAEEA